MNSRQVITVKLWNWLSIKWMICLKLNQEKMNFKELKMVKPILMTVITMEEVIVMQGAPRTYAL